MQLFKGALKFGIEPLNAANANGDSEVNVTEIFINGGNYTGGDMGVGPMDMSSFWEPIDDAAQDPIQGW